MLTQIQEPDQPFPRTEDPADLLGQLGFAAIVVDLDGRVRAWNEHAATLCGYPAAEVKSRHIGELGVLSTDVSGIQQLISGLVASTRWSGELELLGRSGSAIRVAARALVLLGAGGRPRAVLAVFEKRSEACPASRGFIGDSTDVAERSADPGPVPPIDFLRPLTDHMGDGVYALDAQGHVTYMNHAAREMLGWPLEGLRRPETHDIIHGHATSADPRSLDECPIHRAVRKRETLRVDDDAFVRRDGTALAVSYTASPLPTADGAPACVIVFQDTSDRRAQADRVRQDLEKLRWVVRIQEALREGGFVLYAQPIVDVRTRAVVQRELLIRMRSSRAHDAETIGPGQFLPVAEEYGLITDIDRWVVDRAAEIAATGMPVELNVSARSISDHSFAGHVRRALERTGAPPAALVFELTETALVTDEAAARRFLERLHAVGCGIALDDFGTGYGGFTYLKHLPIDTLKIDMEFVSDLTHNAASRNVVGAVVGLARGFGLKTVAEGVEDAQTLELLRHLGVDYAQGFHLGRPAPLLLDRRGNRGDADHVPIG